MRPPATVRRSSAAWTQDDVTNGPARSTRRWTCSPTATAHRARKNVVLFSPGIADHEEQLFGDMLIAAAAISTPRWSRSTPRNVSVYGVQLQRNVDLTPYFHQRLEELARVHRRPLLPHQRQFHPALEQIEKTNNGYYLVTYRSPHAKGETGFQKVDMA